LSIEGSDAQKFVLYHISLRKAQSACCGVCVLCWFVLFGCAVYLYRVLTVAGCVGTVDGVVVVFGVNFIFIFLLMFVCIDALFVSAGLGALDAPRLLNLYR
jgi:hypothetical protein